MVKHSQLAKFNNWYYRPSIDGPETLYTLVVNIQSSISPPLYYGIRITTHKEQKEFSILDDFYNPSNWRAYAIPKAEIKAVTHDIMPDIKRQLIKKLLEEQ